MFAVRQVFSLPLDPEPVLRPYLGVGVETNPWLEPWQRWDAIHYQAIADWGRKPWVHRLVLYLSWLGLLFNVNAG